MAAACRPQTCVFSWNIKSINRDRAVSRIQGISWVIRDHPILRAAFKPGTISNLIVLMSFAISFFFFYRVQLCALTFNLQASCSSHWCQPLTTHLLHWTDWRDFVPLPSAWTPPERPYDDPHFSCKRERAKMFFLLLKLSEAKNFKPTENTTAFLYRCGNCVSKQFIFLIFFLS